jgi:hypothetical protein
MNFDLIRPCDNCPFRSDRPPFGLRPGHIRSILGGGDGPDHWPAKSFPCHKTVAYGAGPNGRDVIPPTAQQCAGVMIILHRENRYNDAMQLGERFGMFDPDKLDMSAPVYPSTEAAVKGQRP